MLWYCELMTESNNAYEDAKQQRRMEAVRRLVKLNIEVPLDPAALSRELEAAHENHCIGDTRDD